MAVNTNWNVEKYKTKFEPEEHWNLKKQFMDAHKSKIPESRLICLAQVFVNMEILGCTYPTKVMKQVQSLSKDIGQEYKVKREHFLKRTFVQASDAANSKVTGLKRKCIRAEKSCIPSNASAQVKQNCINQLKNTYENFTAAEPTPNPRKKKGKKGNLKSPPENLDNIVSSPKAIEKKDKYSELSRLIIKIRVHSNHTLYDVLQMNLQSSFFKLTTQSHVDDTGSYCNLLLQAKNESSSFKFRAHVNNKSIAIAKNKAAAKALKLLLEKCYTIKVLESYSLNSNEVALNDIIEKEDDEENILDKDNIGTKLLKMMGWSGGGLGKGENGITEPIKLRKTVGRLGVGNKNDFLTPRFIKKVRSILTNFIASKSVPELAFSSALSKEQREYIHKQIAGPYRAKLRSRSYNIPGGGRKMFITHKMKHNQILQKIQESDIYGSKYESCPPGSLTLDDFTELLKRKQAGKQK